MARIVAPKRLSFWHPNSRNFWPGLVAPSPSKFATRAVRQRPAQPTPIPAAEINTTPQPWQLRAATLRSRQRLHPNARRAAREARNAALAHSAVLAQRWA